MAKKKTSGLTPSNDSAAPARRRTTARRGAATASTGTATTGPVDGARVADLATVSTAADMGGRILTGTQTSGSGPSFDEIAIAAYLRYLQRGGQDGRDFDDWIEAETELRRLYVR